MTSTTPVVTLSPRDYDAVLFDLDGVLTKTASVHAAAWKKLFDGFLERRAADKGAPFVPFNVDADYRRRADSRDRAFLVEHGDLQ
jgi:beta-phosphoglucomutase-like phosphatase (HAD superfamily)